MSAKEKVYESEVEQDGIFDFKKMYNFAYDFLKDKSYDVSETSYSEKITPDGKEIEVKWEMEKKVNDYIKYFGKVKMSLKGLKSVEVQKNGRKEDSNKGKIKITVFGEIEKDYKKEWEGSFFSKFLRSIYDKYIAGEQHKELKAKYAEDLDELVVQLKSFLVLEGIKGK